MDVNFKNVYRNAIYNYIRVNSGENILQKDIEEAIHICRRTVQRHLHWLEKRNYIRREGKRIYINLF